MFRHLFRLIGQPYRHLKWFANPNQKIIAIVKLGNFKKLSLNRPVKHSLQTLAANAISTTLFGDITVKRAEFMSKKSTTEQVMSLIAYIEAGYQIKLKISVSSASTEYCVLIEFTHATHRYST